MNVTRQYRKGFDDSQIEYIRSRPEAHYEAVTELLRRDGAVDEKQLHGALRILWHLPPPADTSALIELLAEVGVRSSEDVRSYCFLLLAALAERGAPVEEALVRLEELGVSDSALA